MIRVVLPFHLRNLARVAGEVELDVPSPVTIRSTLDALEEKFPALRGTIRDHGTLKRRPFGAPSRKSREAVKRLLVVRKMKWCAAKRREMMS